MAERDRLRSPQAICWDLDGVLRDARQRQALKPVASESPRGQVPHAAWLDYDRAGLHDDPQWGPIAMMRVAWEGGYVNHVVSGSGEHARREAEEWLNTWAPFWHVLRLRKPEEDGIEAGDLKVSYVRELRSRGDEVAAFWEDWPPAIRALQRANVRVVAVNPMYDGMCTCGHALGEASHATP